VVDEFDDDIVVAEQVDEPGDLAGGAVLALVYEGTPNRALAASREHNPVPFGCCGQLLEVIDGTALLRSRGKLGARDRARQPVVALFFAGEHDEVVTLRVCPTVLRSAQPEGEFGAEDRH